MSRQLHIEWINCLLPDAIKKVEDLHSGFVYCRILHQVSPNSLNVNKAIAQPINQVQKLHNWKLIQSAFKTLEITKPIAVQDLVNGKFLDNFEFLKFFKKHFESDVASSTCAEENAQAESKVECGAAQPASKQRETSCAIGSSAASSATAARNKKGGAVIVKPVRPQDLKRKLKQDGPPANDATKKLKQAELETELEAKTKECAQMRERAAQQLEFYVEKLRKIEFFVTDRLDELQRPESEMQNQKEDGGEEKEQQMEGGGDVMNMASAICEKVLELLYETREGFEIPQDGLSFMQSAEADHA